MVRILLVMVGLRMLIFDQMQSGVYIHETVIHDANFVNPDIHTQNIENMWMHVKQKLRR